VRAAAALVALGRGLFPSSGGAAEPDWTAIQYGDGVGCGLFVQFFVASGTEPTVGGRPTAFFPGGAPPSTSESDCLGKCREWANTSLVKTLAAGYRKNLGVTRVTGTCYLQRRPLDQPQAIAAD
jgi:hypothetical protein